MTAPSPVDGGAAGVTLDSLLTEIEADLSLIGELPIDPHWMYSAVRHCQRNMDLDVAYGLNKPPRQCGDAIGRIINLLPQLIEAARVQP